LENAAVPNPSSNSPTAGEVKQSVTKLTTIVPAGTRDIDALVAAADAAWAGWHTWADQAFDRVSGINDGSNNPQIEDRQLGAHGNALRVWRQHEASQYLNALRGRLQIARGKRVGSLIRG
jgi:hypothetical protein